MKGVLLLLILFSSDSYDVVLARLKYKGGGDWYNDPDVLPNLAMEVSKRTNLKVKPEEDIVSADDPRLFTYPFIYITGHGNIRFSEEEIRNLRVYLENGGFIYADDDFGMDKSFRREMKKIFPELEFVEIPFDHPIYHIFYDFNDGLPKIHEHYKGPPKGYGLFIGGRMAVFYTYNTNISDGWTPVHKDPPEVREAAFKMGINILLYALSY
jgi:hypothetical protein